MRVWEHLLYCTSSKKIFGGKKMRMGRKIVVLSLSLVLVFFTATACFARLPEGLVYLLENTTASVERAEAHEVGFTERFTWVFGSTTGSTTLHRIQVDYFADHLYRRSNGQIVVHSFFDGALGSDTELLTELVNRGAVDFYTGMTATMSGFADIFNAFDQYYLFTDTRRYYYMFRQEGFMDWLNKHAAEGGLRVMTLDPVFFRHMFADRPITSVQDVQGLRMRTTTSRIHLSFWEALGTNPTAVALSELFTALQQGVVDAAENGYQNYTGANLHHVARYVIETGHWLHTMCIAMNAQAYADLPPAVRDLVDEAFAASSRYIMSIAQRAEQYYKQMAIEAGNTIITWDDLDEDFQNALLEAAAVQTQAIIERVGQELWDEFYGWAKPFEPNI